MLPSFIVFVVLTTFLTLTNTLPNGAPASVCDSMLPFHGGGIPAMTSPSPFRISPFASAVGQGQILRVEIESNPPDLTYGGFMIHARSTSPPYQVVGRFAPSADGAVKLMNCDGADNTATHVNTSPKRDLGLEWQAPGDFLGEVVFKATVAQEYDKFWVAFESTPVQIVPRGAPIPPSVAGISTTRRPATTTVTSFVPPPVRNVPISSDSFYDGCGTTKSCFGFPDGCIATKSCQIVAAATVRGERYQFEIKADQAQIGQAPGYAALGISEDGVMGDDSVMECIPDGGSVRLFSSWTNSRPSLGVTRDNVPQNIVRLLNSSYVDGTIYCKIERDSVSTVRGKTFDLINKKYHLLIATGRNVNPNGAGFHDIAKRETAEPQFLAEIAEFQGASKLLLRLHGAFMITAWIGTASLGILIARYYKQTWVGSQMCGKDQWFVWHRTFMVLTWLLTMAGFIIIFVEINGWSAAQNPHAILGVVTTVICFLQPIGALFRPAPNHKNRPIFNWIHWLGGNLAHILAIVTIFFAVKLSKAELPEWLDYILVAFVAFHVFMHLVLSISGCVSERRSGQRVNSFPMTDITPNRAAMMTDRKQDAPFSGLRKILLTIYIVIIIMFVIALVVIAVLAPIEDTVQSFKTKLMS